MKVVIFSFSTPVNHLHGSSLSAPPGGTTEMESGDRTGEEPSVTGHG